MISLYTTIFNLSNFNFDIEEAFSNWFYYVDEVVVTTLKDQLEEVTGAIESTKFKDFVKIISMDIDIWV